MSSFKVYRSAGSDITVNIEGLSPANEISTKNSSILPLQNGGLFTGLSDDVTEYPSVTVNFICSHNCIIYIDFSPDDSNWSATEYAYTGTEVFTKRIPVVAKYVRLRVRNVSGLNQTYLRLQTILGNQEIEQTVSLDTSNLTPANVVSTQNSTITPLDVGGSFVGVLEDVSKYPSVTTNVYSDQAGVLQLQFSPDGTNWNLISSDNVTANVGLAVKSAVLAKYFRVVFVNNSGIAENTLRLQTIFGTQLPELEINATVDTSSLVPINKVSTLNSTSTASLPYTGTGEDAIAYPSITILSIADTSGTIYVDFSSNNSNWDYTDSFVFSSGVKLSKRIPVLARYFRIRATGGALTYFRLQTILGSQEIEQIVSLDTDTIAPAGIVSSVNSTTTPLTDAQQFSGVAEDVSRYSSLTVSLATDRNGVLTIKFSPDGTNWDISSSYSYTASAGYTKTLAVAEKYTQIVFNNNSGGNQSYLRLQTIYGSQEPEITATVDTSGLTPGNIVSTNNTTIETLSADATFTGTADDVTKYPSITINYLSTQDGELYVDFSSDSSNWFSSLTNVTANTGGGITASVLGKYFRLRFHNLSGISSASINIQSILGSQLPDQTVNAIVDTSGLVPTNVTSTNNSSTTPLGNGQTFTGTADSVVRYPSLTINLIADANCTLYADFSSDSTNWDIATSYAYTSGSSFSKRIPVLARYFRIRLASAGDQTYLRLQTILGSQEIEQTVNVDTSGLVPKNAISTFNSTTSTVLPFTGTGEDVSSYPSVTISVITDVNGTLYLEFSSNNSNWDSSDSFSYTSGLSYTKRIPVIGRYFRVRFTSGGSPTYMRLQTILGSQEIQQEVTVDTTNIAPAGYVSVVNATATPLTNGQTFTGTGEDVSRYASVIIAVKTDQNGTLQAQFSPDNTNWDSALSFTVEADVNEVHRITVTRQYYRMVITNNSGSNQTYLRASSIYGSGTALTSVANSTIQQDADTILSRSITTGLQPNGKYTNVPVDTLGHLEVGIHSPILPFGSLHTEQLSVILQLDGVYVLNPELISASSANGGTTYVEDSAMVCSSSSTILGQAVIQSRKRIRYRAGQGTICRFTGMWPTGAGNLGYQLIGMGHAEDGYYFGYVGAVSTPVFGILHVQRGKREIRQLTISTGSSTAENVTVTLNGVAFSVPVTNSGSTLKTAWEISVYTFSGWSAEQIGSTVLFIRNSSGPASGAYSISGTTIVGSFAQIRAGVNSTDTFIPQTSWNTDRLDGSNGSLNPSGMLLDPSKVNIFEIGMQYLGSGVVTFLIEYTQTGNNYNMTQVHQIYNPNVITTSHVRNPSFPFSIIAYNLNNTDYIVKSYSAMGAVEGKIVRTGPLISYLGSSSSVSNSAINVLFMFRNSYYFGGIPNQSVIILNSISASARGGNNVVTTIYIIKNPTISAGIPNFTNYSNNRSCALFTNATGMTCTYADNSQLLYSATIGETGEITFSFLSSEEEFDIQPGEYIAICAKASTTTSIVHVSLNTREDQ